MTPCSGVRYSRKVELARRQWSGSAKGVIEGIGVVTCVYVNPTLDRLWVIDYRIYAPEDDGRTELEHVREMLKHTAHHKRLAFRTVLMETWYAAMPVWECIASLGKRYYCPVKSNRLVSLSPAPDYERVDGLSWSDEEVASGRLVHVRKMPKGHRVKLFRLARSSGRTDYVVTNDLAQSSASDAREACAVRWKVEQLHREAKQGTGVERCQCRKGRIQRNHVGCALLVWVRLKSLADEVGTTVYALKRDLLSGYMVEQLRSPTIRMTLA